MSDNYKKQSVSAELLLDPEFNRWCQEKSHILAGKRRFTDSFLAIKKYPKSEERKEEE